MKCSPLSTSCRSSPAYLIDLRKSSLSVPTAKALADRLQSLHESLIQNIKIAQDHQARYYDAKHKRIEFQIGDKVWLLSHNVRTERPSKKLDWKRLDPFQITKRIGMQAYELDLPNSMRIHPVFHVSL